MHQIRFRPGRSHAGELTALPQIPQLDLKGPTSEGREGEGGRVRRRGEGFFIIFKHSWAPKRSWKFSHGGPGKSWKSPGFFFVSKRVGTLRIAKYCAPLKLAELLYAYAQVSMNIR